ncbi:response regulator [Luteibacter anthropi]|nr:response regulator [Luteibacter anthropi]URX62230.1 response regulator [Luteibacter anthropi]
MTYVSPGAITALFFPVGAKIVRRILVVDDDEEIGDLLRRFLERNGFAVDVAMSGVAMDEYLGRGDYDLMTLDLMLPGEDGLSLCRRVRAKSALPIIMLTATGATSERIVGLEVGADDYLAKPFDPRELLARIRAILRRAEATQNAASGTTRACIRFAGWSLDVARRELRATDDTLVPLSGGEFDLLLAFVEHPQRVLTREQLIDLARGSRHEAFDRSIDVQVSRLRRKFGADSHAPELIRTIRNVGYMFVVPVDAA